ncbi:hypothetical protein L6452_26091 [Arctium lappa]|uniref:Uncharacterized protein n=1 Tax=Arctium lappa TaxID=4217 RepID=A0ACB9AB96_ARCLA|nr:hypothetical protein L6452_26091 [Arctium lappa]
MQKNFFKCPAPECSNDISDFLDNPQFQSGREKNVEASDLSDGREEEMEEVEALMELMTKRRHKGEIGVVIHLNNLN